MVVNQTNSDSQTTLDVVAAKLAALTGLSENAVRDMIIYTVEVGGLDSSILLAPCPDPNLCESMLAEQLDLIAMTTALHSALKGAGSES